MLAELESVAYSVSTGAEALRGALRACLARFKIAVETTAGPIPLCRALTAFPLGGERGLYQDGTDMHAQAVAASAELHDAIPAPGVTRPTWGRRRLNHPRSRRRPRDP